MSRATSPYILGDAWLDKRRDGRSPEIWQIARNGGNGRYLVFESTRTSDLTEAKAFIGRRELRLKTQNSNDPEDAFVALALQKYWAEHGCDVVSPDQIASSIRVFLGFLMQSDITVKAKVADLKPFVFDQFVKWRMAPHSYSVPWQGKTYAHSSKGVGGESVQRNLDDIRAALNHSYKNGRSQAVIVRSVPAKFRSPPRSRILSIEELGSIIRYSSGFPDLYRYIALMLATAVRPEAAMAFNPSKQWSPGVVDLHPETWARTKKINPTVPAIPELETVLKEWTSHKAVKSRKTAWRTMRKALGLSLDVHAKTIRHTVATMLLDYPEVSPDLIEWLLGHRVMKKTSAVYAKLHVRHLEPLKAPLSDIWQKAHAEAQAQAGRVHAGHMQASSETRLKITVENDDIIQQFQ